ncbi:DNA-binding MarR family transcriptional regulator [Actinoplanes octamycinicus]|uniref:DNA-binding MarR family transcriptional regulator n=2 Tax=Actinoplanes octamycinicus TaxID=135948 RepID=A0A7W7H5X2_9ACTN|nr:MarR family transcriptional regulator [Actinoplanes octamycinicus]MBB4744247.1 DNA-binding MarR family transcriptional regulator [Actinoplanes octamycinicus]
MELGDRLGLVIKRAEQALIARKTAALREFELTVPQYAALLLLASAEGMSAAQLARESMVTPQTMSTVLANLEAKGLIARTPSPMHQKLVVNRVTPAGHAVLTEADAAASRIESRLAAAFSDDERDQFRALLERAINELTREPAPTSEPTP